MTDLHDSAEPWVCPDDFVYDEQGVVADLVSDEDGELSWVSLDDRNVCLTCLLGFNPRAPAYRDTHVIVDERFVFCSQPCADRWDTGDGWAEFNHASAVAAGAGTAAERFWEWLGGYKPNLVPIVERALNGNDETRKRACNEILLYQQKRDAGAASDELEGLLFALGEPARARYAREGALRGGTRPTGSAVRLLSPHGSAWSRLGNDDVAIHAAFADASAREGFDPAALAAPFRAGRPAVEDQTRRLALARVVAGLRGAGAHLEAIGRVIGRTKQRVAELERLGN